MLVKKTATVALLATALLSSSAFANDDYRKGSEIGEKAFDSVKNIFNSERLHNTIDKANSGVSGLFQGATKSINPDDALCRRMEKNSDKVQVNEWWMNLGYTIQKSAEQGDTSTINKLDDMSIFLKKLSIGVDKKISIFEPAQYGEIGERWMMFWNKNLTFGPGTYRCIRGNNQNQFNIAINTALEIATDIENQNAKDEFNEMINSFTE